MSSTRRVISLPQQRGMTASSTAIDGGQHADSIQYALETEWPVGAAGFEPLHIEIV